MKKENFIEMLKNVYSWLLKKGFNETCVKILLGAIFGAVAAFYFTSCTMYLKTDDAQLNVEILRVEQGEK